MGVGAAASPSKPLAKPFARGVKSLVRTSTTSRRAACRQANTCCGHTCQLRATSVTRAPGNSVSSTTRAFSYADQRRRRPGPVSISIRRKLPFASTFASSLTLILRASTARLNDHSGRKLAEFGTAALERPMATNTRSPLEIVDGR